MSASISAERVATEAVQGLPEKESSLRQILSALVSSILAVCMTIFGMTGLALIILGAWWMINHAPGLSPLIHSAAAMRA